jgi:hypothetical protein
MANNSYGAGSGSAHLSSSALDRPAIEPAAGADAAYRDRTAARLWIASSMVCIAGGRIRAMPSSHYITGRSSTLPSHHQRGVLAEAVNPRGYFRSSKGYMPVQLQSAV